MWMRARRTSRKLIPISVRPTGSKHPKRTKSDVQVIPVLSISKASREQSTAYWRPLLYIPVAGDAHSSSQNAKDPISFSRISIRSRLT